MRVSVAQIAGLLGVAGGDPVEAVSTLAEGARQLAVRDGGADEGGSGDGPAGEVPTARFASRRRTRREQVSAAERRSAFT